MAKRLFPIWLCAVVLTAFVGVATRIESAEPSEQQKHPIMDQMKAEIRHLEDKQRDEMRAMQDRCENEMHAMHDRFKSERDAIMQKYKESKK